MTFKEGSQQEQSPSAKVDELYQTIKKNVDDFRKRYPDEKLTKKDGYDQEVKDALSKIKDAKVVDEVMRLFEDISTRAEELKNYEDEKKKDRDFHEEQVKKGSFGINMEDVVSRYNDSVFYLRKKLFDLSQETE